MNLFFKQYFDPVLAKLKGIEGQTWIMMGLFAVMIISLIEPSWADLFLNPRTKATTVKTGLIGFGKVAAVTSFVAATVAAIFGRINWHWVGVVVAVAIVLLSIDAIVTFLDLV